jgi:hypothetical protein
MANYMNRMVSEIFFITNDGRPFPGMNAFRDCAS